jgi:hypothetical protein
MRTQTQHVLQKLFSEDSIENVSEEQLRRLVEEHPYFTLGHLLLAQKLQTISAADYEAQSERASLYFSEPIWLQSLLHPADEKNLIIREIPSVSEEEQLIEERQLVEQQIEEVHTEVTAEPEMQQEEHTTTEHSSFQENEASEVEKEKIADQDQQPVEVTPIFEPYHTVDYFASQGIRISNEFKPNDRLGQQLKSFTEWLKTMKRMPETKVDEQLDEVTQHNIQEIAAHSLDQKEVITETMAEVLIRQHKEEEAVAIYEKLSLLNPSKSAYFAAKIEQLKGT